MASFRRAASLRASTVACLVAGEPENALSRRRGELEGIHGFEPRAGAPMKKRRTRRVRSPLFRLLP